MIREHPALLLSVPMGLGKTAAALTAAKKLLLAGEIRQILIIAPLRVATDTWPDEILEWEHTREIPFTLIRAEDDHPQVVAAGKATYRLQREVLGATPAEAARAAGLVRTLTKNHVRGDLCEEATPIHIINRESIPWLVKYWGRDWPYDMVIYDEASRLKEGRMRTAGGKKEAKKKGPAPLSEFGSLVRVRHAIKRIVELSGTPSPNGEIDLWGPIYLLDRGERLGRTKTAFLSRWFDQNKYTYEVNPRPGAVTEITSRIKDVMFSLDGDAHIDLPPIVYNNIFVHMAKKDLREYRNFERELVSEEHDVEAVSRGVLTNKLLQFCIAEGTEVLTSRGWIAIQDVSVSDLIWDGVEWVNHGGLLNQGERYIIQSYGVYMTPDHEVLTTRGWMSGHGANCVGLDRAEVRLPHSFGASRDQRQPLTNTALTFDLVDCGPRNQFVVRGSRGPLIVHNCNGSMYRNVEGKKRETVHIHDKKLEALESIVAEEGRNPILVAYSFKFDLERIRKRFPHAVVFEEEPDFVKKWNAGKIQLALAHPASIGHGLNLQYGGHIAVWYGLTWSLELYLQFNKRLPRPGQPHPFVTVHHILAHGTNDERQLRALSKKGVTQDQINGETRAHLRGLKEAMKQFSNPDVAQDVWELVG